MYRQRKHGFRDQNIALHGIQGRQMAMILESQHGLLKKV